jgi:integrase/recombinase XerD
LKFYKNFTIETMVSQGFTLPRCAHKNIRTIGTNDLSELFEVANDLRGWNGSLVRGMLALYFATGVRPSELRLAEFRDLDMKKESLFVRYPKGIGSWASPEWRDIIRGDMLPLISRYLEERESHLIANGKKEAKYLFPNLYRGKDDFYSANCWRKNKQKLVEISGIDFKIKDFRPTLTSLTVNEDLSRLPAMSIQLGHANIGTTQRFYADIQRSSAGKQLKNIWKQTSVLARERPSIDSQNLVTGYD